MAEKSFAGLKGRISSPQLSEDYEHAKRFDKIAVGKLGVYYRDGLRIKTIAYSEMERAFIRVQQVRGRMCCGEACFEYSRIVFVCGGREISDVLSEKPAALDEALEAIHEAAPELAIGV